MIAVTAEDTSFDEDFMHYYKVSINEFKVLFLDSIGGFRGGAEWATALPPFLLPQTQRFCFENGRIDWHKKAWQ